MKAGILSVLFLFAISPLYAQEPADALRYSWLTQNGTARNQAVGGAGASLGGEFSSLFINPAGLGFYKTNEFVITPGYALKSFASNYKENAENSNSNNFNLGASGILFSSFTPDRKIKSSTFAIGVNRIADFNKNIYYKGLNTTSSYSEKFLEELRDNNVTDPGNAANNFPFGTSEAFNTYLIDTIQAPDGSVSGYRSQADPAFGLMQENKIRSTGGITDLSAGFGINLKEKLYFGGTLSFDFLNYTRHGDYRESDASGNPNNNFNFFQVSEYLNTNGIGANAKVGVIYKPQDDVRLGLAIYTPTSYELTDKYSIQINTDLEGYGGTGIKSQSSFDLNNGEYLVSKYKLITPFKFIVSGSYFFHSTEDVKQQRGFITADVEYANYKGARFKANANDDASAKSYYSSLSDVIKTVYKNTVNARIGGELKFDTYMFRLGGAYYGNPYQGQSASLYKISGGVGYRNKGVFIDLTYVYTLAKDLHYPYMLQDKMNVPAYIKTSSGNVIMTVGFKI